MAKHKKARVIKDNTKNFKTSKEKVRVRNPSWVHIFCIFLFIYKLIIYFDCRITQQKQQMGPAKKESNNEIKN